MEKYLLIPLDETVVFPGMTVTMPLDTAGEARVLLVPRHEGTYAKVGTVAEVVEIGRLPGGAQVATLTGQTRALLGAAETSTGGRLYVEVEEQPDETPPPGQDARARDRVPRRRRGDPRAPRRRRPHRRVPALDHRAGRARRHLRLLARPDASSSASSCSRRSTSSSGSSSPCGFQRERLAELQVRRRIRDDVESGAQKQQREYFLRKQLESIRKELGEDEALRRRRVPRRRSPRPSMPDEVREQAERELGRLERMGDSTGEASMIRTYLDWLLAVPWGKTSEERLDPKVAREVLDADHAGLEDVKERIVEYLAVRKLRQERGIEEDKRSGAILTLIGPPGTGKTSIGESIARALNREFVRMSLGGVRDEAEIRGHRRTYIGALPGRLVRALRDAGTMNPVIMLDEVDKVGADWRGDPSAALLEVLDPAQNHSFRDHYLDVELDLSQVVFIATANVAETIPGPLLDRMEVIRFDGYTVDEKVAIARGYLWPRQRERNGLREDEVEIADEVLADDRRRVHPRGRRPPARARARQAAPQDRDPRSPPATRSRRSRSTSTQRARRPRPAALLAGVGRAHGRARRRDRPGRHRHRRRRPVRRGDAGWTAKATRLVLTGQLGDVMKESAQIALSWVRAHADDAGHRRPTTLKGQTFHVHVPAGAIPKDGPSAGVTMTTALASLLTGRPVKHTVGMTGEVTLQGRVLPIGGLKQKVLAAHAAGLTEVILPERNRADLEDVPEDVREGDDLPPGAQRRRGARARARAGAGPCAAGGLNRSPRRSAARRTSSNGAGRFRSSTRRSRGPSASTSSAPRSAASRPRR